MEETGLQEGKGSKISNTTAALMITVAVVFDLIGLIPVVGQYFSAIGAIPTFGIWFLILGLPLLSPKKIASWGLNLIAEWIPAVGEFYPGITAGIILMILLTKTQEKTGIDVMKTVSAVKNPASALKPSAPRMDDILPSTT